MGDRLYVGNLPFTATPEITAPPETLRDAFVASGNVAEVHMVTDRDSGPPRGFAFVLMGNAHEASKAMR